MGMSTLMAAVVLALGAPAHAAAAASTGPMVPAEVHARLPAAVGGITTLPDGRLVIGYHPFYAPAQKVGLLNAARNDTTPYPDADWQTCTRPDGSPKDPDTCLNWVLGLHTDAQGVLVYESLGVFRGDFVEVHMSLVNR